MLKRKIVLIIISLVSLLGMIDSSYLTYSHYSGVPVNCTILDGCGIVTKSEFSKFGPVPTSLIGLFFYAFIFALSIYLIKNLNRRLEIILLGSTLLAFLFSLFLVYLQVFVIMALCLYCLLSAFFVTILFLTSAGVYSLSDTIRKESTAPETV